jgi:hypothetical protein
MFESSGCTLSTHETETSSLSHTLFYRRIKNKNQSIHVRNIIERERDYIFICGKQSEVSYVRIKGVFVLDF